MTTKGDVVRQLGEAKGRFSAAFGIQALALFGSYARGAQTSESDVDVLVDMKQATFDHYMDLKFFLEERLGANVDLVLKDTLKAGLRERVEREMISV